MASDNFSALGHVVGVVSEHLNQIKSLFKPGAKITVMVRFPNMPDRDFMLTDEDLDELTAMIARRKGNETKQ